MEHEFEIPYKAQPKEESKAVYDDEIEDSEESDVEMKESPAKVEEKVEYHKHEDVVEETKEKHETHQDDDEDDIYTPIKALSTMNSDWIIKARVSKKYPVKQWSNDKGDGKLLNFELIDRHGTQIQATLFNKAVDKFDPILEQDKVY